MKNKQYLSKATIEGDNKKSIYLNISGDKDEIDNIMDYIDSSNASYEFTNDPMQFVCQREAGYQLARILTEMGVPDNEQPKIISEHRTTLAFELFGSEDELLNIDTFDNIGDEYKDTLKIKQTW